MEWKVVNAVSRDVEREHLNKILKDIRAEVDRIESLKTGAGTDVRDIVGTMVEGNTEHGMEVLYDAVKKVLNFAITGYLIKIKGDVVGQGEVTGTGTVVINTELAEDFETIPEPDDNGRVYWRKFGEWEQVPTVVRNLKNLVGDGLVAAFFDPVLQIIDVATRQIEVEPGELTVANADAVAGNPLLGLADVVDSNTGTLQGITVDSKGRVTGTTDATITGTPDEIDVVNGDAAAGPPTISLADLTDTGVGTFKLLTRDSKGRLEGTEDGQAVDVPYDNGTSGLTATDVQAAIDEVDADLDAHLADTADPHATVVQTITNGDTTHAPSGDAVFDALALKADGAGITVAKGTYTPTLTGVTNIAASTAFSNIYTRIGDIVTVSGFVNIDPTSASTASEIGISLPIASNLAAQFDCSGVANTAISGAVDSGGILGDTANDRASLRFTPSSTANTTWVFTFTYRVI